MALELDSTQSAVVHCDSDKILVVAGSGSGKTRVLTERLKLLLKEVKDSSKIVAITFTNAAAEEMKERLGDTKSAFIGTIHSYANRILLMNGYDTSQYIEEDNFDEFFKIIKEEKIELPEVEHLLVDEFQDIDNEQYTFFCQLKPKNFMYVGDDWQNIYSFRGSNCEIFIALSMTPGVRVFYMGNNYRSGAEIIEFANRFIYPIGNKIDKETNCLNPGGDVVKYKHFDPLVLISCIQEKGDYKDWFVLTRNNSQISIITDILAKANIPCDTFKKSELDSKELKKKLKENTVKVLTVHSAKGLENTNVAVLGVRPFWDEERRVAYVAATRAKETLLWFSSIKNLEDVQRPKVITW